MDFSIIIKTFPDFLTGLVLTIELLVLSVSAGLVFAGILAALRVGPNRFLGMLAWGFTYTFRGTPLLVQLYLIYYGMGQFSGVRESWLWYFLEDPYICAWIALTLNHAAYATEIFYNALIRFPRQELEAYHAFGMGRWKIFIRFIIPTTVRLSLQSYSNEVIFMLHATAMVSLITLLDITGVARVVHSKYYTPFEAFMTAGVFYLFLTLLITLSFRGLEKRMRRHLTAR